ncbi:hypothetical protein [Rickettsia amblyommatis]|uniref:hypothetical protein n=1 Tax=Rickettsia amblyommatis TaxID=33989 RepID=UPI000A9786A2|nr:hypothetical protein [Rickettsia amblyommatis]
MSKALFHELSDENTKANHCATKSQFSYFNKTQAQYLDKIESSRSTSKPTQLKRKIISIFDANTAYELLSSCCFIGIVDHQYQIKLLKNIMLSANTQNQILQQVQMIYGNSIEKLSILSFTELADKKQNAEYDTQNYLLQLSKELNPDSIWYKVRKFMIEHYNRYIDSSVLSKLVVAEEDTCNKKIILKSTSSFYDYYVRNNHMQDLDKAFKAQGFTFELMKF